MKPAFPTKGEVWLVSFEMGVSHEQFGSRPAVVLGGIERIGMLAIVPFTTSLSVVDYPHACKINPSKQNGLSTDSIAMGFQIQSVHEFRFLRKMGELSEGDFKAVQNTVKGYLNI